MVLPVSDVDRAKRFYQSLGWRLDGDLIISDEFRVVQFTPPGSLTSIRFGTGIKDASLGSALSLELVVQNVAAARADLLARGVDNSEVFHGRGGFSHHNGPIDRVPGPDPQRRSYQSFAAFNDPDGNSKQLGAAGDHTASAWTVTGCNQAMHITALADLLRETAEHQDRYEKTHPKHNWWDWYAPYLSARQNGSTPEEASVAAGRYMEELGKLVPG